MAKTLSRRTMLKTTGAAAAFTGVSLSAPNVIRANDKVVRYLGTATTMGSEIDKKLFEDTGIKVQYIPVTTDEVTKRVLTQPNSFDIVDTEYFSLPKLVPSGNILGMDSTRISQFDKISTTHTLGEIGGKKIGDQGTAPKKVFYLKDEFSNEFSDEPTRWATLIPTVFNADTLGIRPDLIGRPISTWAELLNPG